ncbi:hypothetical protein C8R43DRAFT_965865 [Mycena crocata]|nr:hypothetical protein C8R43DRAFT_965865 [Mycena crocata]
MSKVALFTDSLTPEQDRELKREAINNAKENVAPRRTLQQWLDAYMLPPPFAPPAPPTRYYDRLRAQLIAKKARAEALMQTRARALEKRATRWPRLYERHEKEDRANRERARVHRIELARQREAAAVARVEMQLRADADARVACGFVYFWPLLDRAKPGLNGSRPNIIRPILYRHISVGDSADRLVRSLASSEKLQRLWSLVLPGLKKLQDLTITHHVPLNSAILPRITFRLSSFTSNCILFGSWLAFVTHQSALQSLICESDFLGTAPPPTSLPLLRCFKGRSDDVAKFADYAALQHIWFWGRGGERQPIRAGHLQRLSTSPARLLTLRVHAGQLLMLLKWAPDILSTLQHLLLDEDRAWCAFGPQTTAGCLMTAVAGLDSRTPNLRTLTLVCAQDATTRLRMHPLVPIAHAEVFARKLGAACNAPALCTFHMCAANGCGTWFEWRAPAEAVFYTDREEHSPWRVDPAYPNFRIGTSETAYIAEDVPSFGDNFMDPAFSALTAEYLAESLRMDGFLPPPATAICAVCQIRPGDHHCGECVVAECAECIASGHAAVPLHHIRRWNGQSFDYTNLKALGVTMQVGHGPHGVCPHPSEQRDWRIIHTSGLHEVALHFCACPDAKGEHKQLMEARLIRARVIGSCVAITFAMATSATRLQPQAPVHPHRLFGGTIEAELKGKRRRSETSPSGPAPASKRHRSAPLQDESSRRVEKYADAAWEMEWQAGCQELSELAKTFAQAAPTEDPAARARNFPAHFVDQTSAEAQEHAAYVEIWAEEAREAQLALEAAQQARADQWGNVVQMMTDAMPEPERNQLDLDVTREIRLQQSWRSREMGAGPRREWSDAHAEVWHRASAGLAGLENNRAIWDSIWEGPPEWTEADHSRARRRSDVERSIID